MADEIKYKASSRFYNFTLDNVGKGANKMLRSGNRIGRDGAQYIKENPAKALAKAAIFLPDHVIYRPLKTTVTEVVPRVAVGLYEPLPYLGKAAVKAVKVAHEANKTTPEEALTRSAEGRQQLLSTFFASDGQRLNPETLNALGDGLVREFSHAQFIKANGRTIDTHWGAYGEHIAELLALKGAKLAIVVACFKVAPWKVPALLKALLAGKEEVAALHAVGLNSAGSQALAGVTTGEALHERAATTAERTRLGEKDKELRRRAGQQRAFVNNVATLGLAMSALKEIQEARKSGATDVSPKLMQHVLDGLKVSTEEQTWASGTAAANPVPQEDLEAASSQAHAFIENLGFDVAPGKPREAFDLPLDVTPGSMHAKSATGKVEERAAIEKLAANNTPPSSSQQRKLDKKRDRALEKEIKAHKKEQYAQEERAEKWGDRAAVAKGRDASNYDLSALALVKVRELKHDLAVARRDVASAKAVLAQHLRTDSHETSKKLVHAIRDLESKERGIAAHLEAQEAVYDHGATNLDGADARLMKASARASFERFSAKVTKLTYHRDAVANSLTEAAGTAGLSWQDGQRLAKIEAKIATAESKRDGAAHEIRFLDFARIGAKQGRDSEALSWINQNAVQNRMEFIANKAAGAEAAAYYNDRKIGQSSTSAYVSARETRFEHATTPGLVRFAVSASKYTSTIVPVANAPRWTYNWGKTLVQQIRFRNTLKEVGLGPEPKKARWYRSA